MDHREPERRLSDRSDVEWDAECGRDGSLVAVDVLDVSPTGFFLATRPDVDLQPAPFGVDDIVVLRYAPLTTTDATILVGVVRWFGSNVSHATLGYGVELLKG